MPALYLALLSLVLLTSRSEPSRLHDVPHSRPGARLPTNASARGFRVNDALVAFSAHIDLPTLAFAQLDTREKSVQLEAPAFPGSFA